VRNLARGENGFAGVKVKALLADLEIDVTFDDVKPLFLMEVVVERGTAARAKMRVLDDEEAAGGFAGAYPAGHSAKPECVWMAEAIFAQGNDVGHA